MAKVAVDVKFYSRYSPPQVDGECFPLDSMTQQAFKEDCDVNAIIARFERTGAITHIADAKGFFGDVFDLPTDFSRVNDFIENANASFMTLPASVREQYSNDPYQFLDAVNRGVFKFESPENTASMQVDSAVTADSASSPEADSPTAS